MISSCTRYSPPQFEETNPIGLGAAEAFNLSNVFFPKYQHTALKVVNGLESLPKDSGPATDHGCAMSPSSTNGAPDRY